MTIYSLLFGLEDFTNIADFMKLKEDYLTELLNLENGTHPTIGFLTSLQPLIQKNLWKHLLNGQRTKEIVKKQNWKEYYY